jgi:hypothetical protein
MHKPLKGDPVQAVVEYPTWRHNMLIFLTMRLAITIGVEDIASRPAGVTTLALSG